MVSISPSETYNGMRATRSSPNAATPPSALAKQQQQQRAQLAQIAELSATDRHVRAHEEAHLAAAGQYAVGGASFTYKTGPDGQQYAVGGEVPIDDSPVAGNPKATVQKERAVQAAANAPNDPSNQDRAVAAQAASLQQTAELQLAHAHGSSPSDNSSGATLPAAYGSQATLTGLLVSITA